MAHYKLTYFDIRGLGEPIRILLTYGGIKFDEVRISFDEWPHIKSQFPLGQLPVLDINGKRIYQSFAIMRYLAKQFKVNGRNDWENLNIDIAAQTIEDLRQKIVQFAFEQDEERKEKAFNKFKEEQFAFYMVKFDTMAKENRGYFAASSLTWVDMYFVGVLDLINHFTKEDVYASYPNIKKVVDHVKNHPNLRKYFTERKDAMF